jgi:tetratricopeptide (TPR) repeat protein
MDGLLLRQTPIKRSLFIACLVAMIAVTAWLYAPGLQGSFVFDDFANLPALGSQGPIVDAPSLLRYLTSGNADPTGRPLSMASFLVEARDWPADPFPFKRDNLILHLLNGALLALLLLRLGDVMGIDSLRARFAAVFGAALWLMHPLFVSTVLYAVQREAMLPATFTLLALLTWLRGRRAALRDGRRPFAAYVGVYLLTAAAIACKANGLIVPLLIVCIETTLPCEGAHDIPVRRWTYLTFGPLAAVVIAGLAWTALTNLGAPPIPVRGWSVGQRLLTEPSILLDYLGRLMLVVPPSSSLFHDDYTAATGLFSPWYTAPSMLVCTALIIWAFLHRRRHPVMAAATLFFFAAHVMESSALALELYFEHRNYLPAMLLFWPLGLLLCWIPSVAARNLAALALFALAGTMTYANAVLWADPVRQAIVWARLSPASPRAQAYAALMEADRGDLQRAVAHADAAARRFPAEPQVAFAQTTLHCRQGNVDDAMLGNVQTALRTAPRDPGKLLSQWLNEAVGMAVDGSCEGMSVEAVERLVDVAATNPAISALPGRRQDIAHLRGVIALARGDGEDALRHFNQALAEDPNAAIALNQAATLGSGNYPSLGLRHLAYFDQLPVASPPGPSAGMRWLHALVLIHQGYWEHEIVHLRRELQRHVDEQR